IRLSTGSHSIPAGTAGNAWLFLARRGEPQALLRPISDGGSHEIQEVLLTGPNQPGLRFCLVAPELRNPRERRVEGRRDEVLAAVARFEIPDRVVDRRGLGRGAQDRGGGLGTVASDPESQTRLAQPRTI